MSFSAGSTKFFFRPPKPTYSFVPFGPPANADYRIRIRRDAKTLTSAAFPDLVQYDSLFRRFFIPKPACKRKHIACVYARSVLLGTNARNTILLSHTNGEDLGLMISRIALLCQRVSVDVVAYDYFGYGRSSGSCSEKNLYKDIECVYEFMVEKMMIPAKRVRLAPSLIFTFTTAVPLLQIIAIGSSLGSVGTVHLASRQVLQGVDPTRRLRIRFGERYVQTKDVPVAWTNSPT